MIIYLIARTLLEVSCTVVGAKEVIAVGPCGPLRTQTNVLATDSVAGTLVRTCEHSHSSIEAL